MSTNNEERFYEKLHNIPPVPDSLFDAIDQDICRHEKRRIIRKMCLSVAAILILIVTAGYFTSDINNSQSISKIAMNEIDFNNDLDDFADHFDSETIDDEFDTYALIDSDLFETKN